MNQSILQTVLERLMMLVPVWLSLTVHEFSHGWSAYKLGDPTAKESGRLTLNPLAHIDPIGTLLLPLLGIPFGWAKPVPVNPLKFDRKWSMRKGMLITAAAGPASNFILALLLSIALGLLIRFNPNLAYMLQAKGPNAAFIAALFNLMVMMIQINVALALFNLIPIYPLDGSRIADGLMPASLRPAWEKFCKVAPYLLIAVLIFGASFLIERPARLLLHWLGGLIGFIAG